MKTSLLAFVVPSVFACGLAAQTPHHLVGNTRNLPQLRHTNPVNCAPIDQCPLPAGLSAAALPLFAGGTGWDPKRPGAWVTNGTVLAKFDDNCNPMCPFTAIPFPGIVTVATGLEVVEGADQLWMIDSAGGLHRYTNACPPVHLGVCNTGLGPAPGPQVTSGLAVDEGLGLVFISYPNDATGINWIVVSSLANPCVELSRFIVPPCFGGFGLVTGLACNWGNRTLFATDGLSVVAMRYNWAPPNIVIVNQNCCPVVAVGDPMIGLAVRPGGATSIGIPCANGSCAPCPMNHTLGNDPVLGNLNFRLNLDDAFGNSFSFCLIGDGPCNPPGISAPALCGPIYTVPYLGALGVNLISGPSICGGSTSFLLPLPVAPTLAGFTYSSQCLNLCVGPAGGLGFALSNCLSWTIQGN